MNITSVTASFKRLQSLPGHCNVATGFTMTAEVPEGADPALIKLDLRSEIEQDVNDWIDAKLEEAGQPALYSAEPRFSLIHWKQADLVFIVPAGTVLEDMPGNWTHYPRGEDDIVYSRQRLPALREMVDELGLTASEFDTANALRVWAWVYLDLAITWSIIRIHARIDEAVEGIDGCDLLGLAIVPGDVYAALRADSTLMVELSRGIGAVGYYDDVVRAGNMLGTSNLATLRNLEDVRGWIERQRLEHADEEAHSF